jgi:hypothetical protein
MESNFLPNNKNDALFELGDWMQGSRGEFFGKVADFCELPENENNVALNSLNELFGYFCNDWGELGRIYDTVLDSDFQLLDCRNKKIKVTDGNEVWWICVDDAYNNESLARTQS